jgi:hypothetical protein
VRQADSDWGDAHKWEAVGNSEFRVSKQSRESDERPDTQRDPDESRQKEDALNIPIAPFYLLLERREFDTLFDSGKALLVDHHSALVLEPLSKTYERDKRHDHDCNFHVFTLPFTPIYSWADLRVAVLIENTLATA